MLFSSTFNNDFCFSREDSRNLKSKEVDRYPHYAQIIKKTYQKLNYSMTISAQIWMHSEAKTPCLVQYDHTTET